MSVLWRFYLFVKFGLVLIYIFRFIEKKSSLIVQCSVHYLHFSFEKHLPSQVLQDFSVENLETTRRSIYLELTLYITWGAFSWFVCYPYFFFFFLFFHSFFLFYLYFPWQTLTIHNIGGTGESIIIFLVFHLYPLTNIHLIYRHFY